MLCESQDCLLNNLKNKSNEKKREGLEDEPLKVAGNL
jgi:hypothetical protein